MGGLGCRERRDPVQLDRRTRWRAVALFAAVTRASAAEPPGSDDQAQPCRPTITCTAEIVAPGAFEVEAGAQQLHAAGSSQWSFPVLLKQGFAPWLELQVGSNGYTILRDGRRSAFLDNAFVGPKFHLRGQGTVLPSLSLSAQVSVPTFDADGYDRNWDLFFVGLLSKDIGPIHVDANAGANLWRLDSLRSQGFVSGVLSKSLPADFTFEAETYYLSEAAPVAPRDGGLRGALTWKGRSWLVLDVGGDAGFFPSVREYTLFAGLTVIPIVFFKRDPAE